MVLPPVEDDEGETDDRERGDCDRGTPSTIPLAKGESDPRPSPRSSMSAVRLSAAVCFSDKTQPAPTGDPLPIALAVGESWMLSLLGASSTLRIGVATEHAREGRLLLAVTPAWKADRFTGVSGMMDGRDKLATKGFGSGTIFSALAGIFIGEPFGTAVSPSCC
jgi:hypothetical protein